MYNAKIAVGPKGSFLKMEEIWNKVAMKEQEKVFINCKKCFAVNSYINISKLISFT